MMAQARHLEGIYLAIVLRCNRAWRRITIHILINHAHPPKQPWQSDYQLTAGGLQAASNVWQVPVWGLDGGCACKRAKSNPTTYLLKVGGDGMAKGKEEASRTQHTLLTVRLGRSEP